MDYTKICFVVMPFGIKPVGRKKLWLLPFITREQTVDFDKIYDDIFVPAIEATKLPEGGNLEPRRTDKDFFSGDIAKDMFEYIQYSRFVLADITGLNANVFYELGVRHKSNESGTAIFRQTISPIPFDINQIKAFPYEYQPEEKAGGSRKLITRVLTESLVQNRVDSPVQKALVKQQNSGAEGLLHEAENAIRNEDEATALLKFRQAAKIDDSNPILRLKIGLLFKKQGKLQEALTEFDSAIKYCSEYAEAYREKGIAESRLYVDAGKPKGMPTGEESIKKATELNPEDFDAFASWGGALKRLERYQEALEKYDKAVEISNGHPYPLLNEIIVQSLLNKKLSINEKQNSRIKRAEKALRLQVNNLPPYNKPWSFFDLSTIYLFKKNKNKFLKKLQEGINLSTADWELHTHLDTLLLLKQSDIDLPGLDEGIKRLKKAQQNLA